MSTNTSRRDEQYFFVLKRIFDSALPPGNVQRVEVQKALDNIVKQQWEDKEINNIATHIRSAIA